MLPAGAKIGTHAALRLHVLLRALELAEPRSDPHIT